MASCTFTAVCKELGGLMGAPRLFASVLPRQKLASGFTRNLTKAARQLLWTAGMLRSSSLGAACAAKYISVPVSGLAVLVGGLHVPAFFI